MTEHISCNCECKFNSTTCHPKQKWSNKTCQCECKNYCKCKENFSWNVSTCISENSKYLKNVSNTSVTKCNEIRIVMDIVSTKKTNTIATNVANTASINCHCKKVRDYKKVRYFTYSFISDHITIDHYHYLLPLCKTKRYNIK